MAFLAQKLATDGGGESVVFLNEIVAQLWPNINKAGSKMLKDIADPMLKATLPGPLSSLHFTKVDFGEVPMRFSNAVTTKTDSDGIKVDMNVDWDGKCDIELDGAMVPALGVEHVKLQGRLELVLCPLINVLPLIGAVQAAFINPPSLKLDFTGAANIADLSVIDDSIRQVILDIINGMATLPNRYLTVKLDEANDWFRTYIPPLGIIRVTVKQAWGFAEESKTKTKKLLSKLTGAAPDCYARVSVGAEEPWQTSTKDNLINPTWNETHDFVVSDYNQSIQIDVKDKDMNADDDVGLAVVLVKDIMSIGGQQELPLKHKGESTDGVVSVACEYFELDAGNASLSASEHKGEGKICGIANILVAGAFNVKGHREALRPSVVVKWGPKLRYQTAMVTGTPGIDTNNPAFDQNFRVPVTADMVGSGAESFRIALMDGEKEVGGVEVPFKNVVGAPGMTLQDRFDVGGGTTVRASIGLRGLKAAGAQNMALPERQKHKPAS